jgi:hypothetical protein
MPDTRFIFRTHPVLSYSAAASRAPELREITGNVEVSERSIAEDIALSRWALYRGSSAVFAAVLGGVRPLYLHADREMSIDPLYALSVWRKAVSDPSDLAAVVREDRSSTSLDPAMDAAMNFCRAYMHPLQPDVLLRLLS